MTNEEKGRVLVGIPNPIGNLLRERAKVGNRPVSNEAVALIERGLAAEKTASENRA